MNEVLGAGAALTNGMDFISCVRMPTSWHALPPLQVACADDVFFPLQQSSENYGSFLSSSLSRQASRWESHIRWDGRFA